VYMERCVYESQDQCRIDEANSEVHLIVPVRSASIADQLSVYTFVQLTSYSHSTSPSQPIYLDIPSNLHSIDTHHPLPTPSHPHTPTPPHPHQNPLRPPPKPDPQPLPTPALLIATFPGSGHPLSWC